MGIVFLSCLALNMVQAKDPRRRLTNQTAQPDSPASPEAVTLESLKDKPGYEWVRGEMRQWKHQDELHHALDAKITQLKRFLENDYTTGKQKFFMFYTTQADLLKKPWGRK